MAELLVRIKDKTSDDVYQNASLTKRGDVIVIQPDGWVWGSGELTNPDWRIIKVPGVDPSELTYLTDRELDTRDVKIGIVPTLQPRAYKLDLDNPFLSKQMQAFIADDSRTNTALVADETLNPDVMNVEKPAVADPNILSL